MYPRFWFWLGMQSKQCQRQHWKVHKVACKINIEFKKSVAQLGPFHAQRGEALKVWSKKNAQYIGVAIVSALGIMKDMLNETR